MFGMSDAMELVIVLVLLPLVPAFLIFLVFPKSELAAQGPLQGLSIRAGGAFGGYLVILLVLISWIQFSGAQSNVRTWTVLANVMVKDRSGRIIDPRLLDEDALSVSFDPAYLRKRASPQAFRVRVTATEVEGRIPAMIIRYGDLGNAYIDLEDLEPEVKHERDDVANRYLIKTPLVIQEIAPPGLDGTAPPAQAADMAPGP